MEMANDCDPRIYHDIDADVVSSRTTIVAKKDDESKKGGIGSANEWF